VHLAEGRCRETLLFEVPFVVFFEVCMALRRMLLSRFLTFCRRPGEDCRLFVAYKEILSFFTFLNVTHVELLVKVLDEAQEELRRAGAKREFFAIRRVPSGANHLHLYAPGSLITTRMHEGLQLAVSALSNTPAERLGP
jgi:hypothetical protein